MKNWQIILILLALLALHNGLFYVAVNAQHHGYEWFDEYKSEKGYPCCGETDCKPVKARIVSDLGTAVVLVEIQGVQVLVPRGSIHPSQTGEWWLCRQDYEGCADGKITPECVRCLFSVEGMS